MVLQDLLELFEELELLLDGEGEEGDILEFVRLVELVLPLEFGEDRHELLDPLGFAEHVDVLVVGFEEEDDVVLLEVLEGEEVAQRDILEEVG